MKASSRRLFRVEEPGMYDPSCPHPPSYNCDALRISATSSLIDPCNILADFPIRYGFGLIT